VAEVVAARERAVGLEHHVQPAALLQQRAAVLERRELDLVDVRRDARPLDRPGQQAGAPVADADRARQAVLVGALERRPLLPGLAGGPVDEVEVDPVEVEQAQAVLERPAGVAGAGEQLGGDEHLFARDAAGGERAADRLLVAVELGRVDVPVAGLERPAHGVLGLPPRAHLEDAQAEQRHADAVGELDIAHCCCETRNATSSS
jgi:hypothetical protein